MLEIVYIIDTTTFFMRSHTMRHIQTLESHTMRARVYWCAEWQTFRVLFDSRGVSPGSWVYMPGADYETEDKNDAIGTAKHAIAPAPAAEKKARFFIRDCDGQIVGNPAGYRTMRGATQQAESNKSAVYRDIWDRFYAKYPDHSGNGDQSHKLIFEIKPA